MTKLPSNNIRGIILAGGQSRRFGGNKAAIEFAGQTLLTRAVFTLRETLTEYSNQIPLIVGPVETLQSLLPGSPGEHALIIPDKLPGVGPLGGIYSAFCAGNHGWLLIIACDMPFIQANLLEFLCQRALNSNAAIVIPTYDDHIQPLLALYKYELCFPTIEEKLATGEYSLHRLVEEVSMKEDVCFVRRAEIEPFDPAGRSFININYQLEWENILKENK